MDRPYAKKPFAKKSFGQNFLVDETYIRKIIDALNLKSDETIVEIGAGRGALTEILLEKAGKVIAIELDRDLIPALREKFGKKENFRLVEQDALKIDFAEILQNPRSAKLVANLPYNISTAILQRLMEQREVFSELILMFQREVVQRITATVGHKERGFLTVLTEAYFSSEKLFDVPGRAFRPVPKVMSSVARFTPKPSLDVDGKLLRKVVSIGFAQKRKTILNNLKSTFPNAVTVLDTCGIDPGQRAESLSLESWICLTKSLAASSF